MINAQSPVFSQHSEQHRAQAIRGDLRVERRTTALMSRPHLFSIHYESLTLAKIEIKSPLDIVLPATTCPVKQIQIIQEASCQWHLFTPPSREGLHINESEQKSLLPAVNSGVSGWRLPLNAVRSRLLLPFFVPSFCFKFKSCSLRVLAQSHFFMFANLFFNLSCF